MGDSDSAAYIPVLWDADMIPGVGQVSLGTNTGHNVCYKGWMDSAATVCHNPTKAPERNVLPTPFLDIKDTLDPTQ